MSKFILNPLLTLMVFVCLSFSGTSQTWNQKTSCPCTPRRLAIGFNINDMGYVGTGIGLNQLRLNDFWEYNPITDTWLQKSDFPGVKRDMAVGFSIGNTAYVGLGRDTNSYNIGDTLLTDFWKYDQSSDLWIQIADFPGGGRFAAVGMSTDSIGYVFGGKDILQTNFQDFWQYDPLYDLWEQKASFPGDSRTESGWFEINGMLYVVGGAHYISSSPYNELWQYDPTLDIWTQKTGLPVAKFGGVTFPLGNNGYFGNAVIPFNNNFWKYDANSDSWFPDSEFNGVPREDARSFSINGKGYMATGFSESGDYLNELWEYTPMDASINEHKNIISISPNPTSDHFDIYISDNHHASTLQIVNYLDQIVLVAPIDKEVSQINCNNIVQGTYFVRILSGQILIATSKLIVL